MPVSLIAGVGITSYYIDQSGSTLATIDTLSMSTSESGGWLIRREIARSVDAAHPSGI